jgi:plastocyanin
MQFKPWRTLRLARPFVGMPMAAAMLAGLVAGSAMGAAPFVISQKGRAFAPGEIAIKRGDTIRFVNDDGDLLHHAYLQSDSFSFDSGDQDPGSTFEVKFPVTGQFTVRCAIHPKMRLVVVVD